MDKAVNEIINVSVPTKLVYGEMGKIRDLTEIAIQSQFCVKSSEGLVADKNCFCSECKKIKSRQHPFLVWISPEKYYSVSDVDVIFNNIRFALDENQKFFFVLDKASSLNQATANKLLKVLEEPPVGYNFILLTDNFNLLPATIISRSYFISIQVERGEGLKYPIINFFNSKDDLADSVMFEQELKKNKLSEQESVELCYVLMESFLNGIKKGRRDCEYLKNGIEILLKRLRKPPAPGSADIFWKLLYLDFCEL